MSIYVFGGPTLDAREGREILDAIYLGPASQGDVYRTSLRQPIAIAIIDGYFERVPAVWHKEILWAMSQGIHVFGAGSMGALRAAELAPFGMEGVGWIFDSYRAGLIEDDDEVAVAHGPESSGFRPLSEPLVNIRRTLDAAVARSTIRGETAAELLEIARALFYPERNYDSLLRRAEQGGLPRSEIDELRRWLPKGQINQKKEDALAMLREIRSRVQAGLPRKEVSFSFEYTEWWAKARRQAGELPSRPENGLVVGTGALFDELRLAGGANHERVRSAAMLRHLLILNAYRERVSLSKEHLDTTSRELRWKHGLIESQDIQAWCVRNDLCADQFNRLVVDEALIRQAYSLVEEGAGIQLANALRLSGEYAGLAERARDKQVKLEALGLANPSLEDTCLTMQELLAWVFTELLGTTVPTDLAAAARQMGFADDDALRRAAIRELCYRRAIEDCPSLTSPVKNLVA